MMHLLKEIAQFLMLILLCAGGLIFIVLIEIAILHANANTRKPVPILFRVLRLFRGFLHPKVKHWLAILILAVAIAQLGLAIGKFVSECTTIQALVVFTINIAGALSLRYLQNHPVHPVHPVKNFLR